MHCSLGQGVRVLGLTSQILGTSTRRPGGSASSVAQFRKLQVPSVSDVTPGTLLL